jgi:hypothetical protein
MAPFAIGPSGVRIGGYGGQGVWGAGAPHTGMVGAGAPHARREFPREETAWTYRLTLSSLSGL